MFDPTSKPRLFALPCGVDYGAAIVDGLTERFADRPPEELARVEIIVNTTRMRRRLQSCFDTGPARLLPRIRLLTELVPERDAEGAIQTPIGRKLHLVSLVQRLIEAQPDLAPAAAAIDLAESVAALLAEMAEEDVPLDTLEALDVSDQSGHWQRAQDFLKIVAGFVEDSEAAPVNPLVALNAQFERWRTTPPQHPILIVGSTGSRGPTRQLMEVVAKLPQGAVILPGVDVHMQSHAWQSLRDADLNEDHPQYRTLALADAMECDPAYIPLWTDTPTASPNRNSVVSLALRPAPVTHAWLSEGPKLRNVQESFNDVTLLGAESPREEALTIALRLRAAAEDHQSAAVVTPNRTLTRLIAAQLERWGITADDSAGIPLHLTAPGRFLRHTAEALAAPLRAEDLLILLKHPLCHSGSGRNTHLRFTRDLELHIRGAGVLHPSATMLHAFGEAIGAEDWTSWVASTLFSDLPLDGKHGFPTLWERHLALANTLARGSEDIDGSGGLWDKFEGLASAKWRDKVSLAAEFGPLASATEYRNIIAGLLRNEQQRERDAGHPLIRIWGTLEARVMDADLLILAGLNEGSWPEAPSPDPWLNRALRKQAGLLLPERRIGLSAHDFQQAIGGKEVWLTRSVRSDGADTVPSRWLNRLTNLLGGLEEGKPALEDMSKRGAKWQARARQFEAVTHVPPAPRPSPRPPIEARPKKLRVTQIKTLVRDPYALYAQTVLGLQPLDPLVKSPDPATRGTLMHEVFEAFIEGKDIRSDRLLDIAREQIQAAIPWPDTRALWMARLAGVAEDFVTQEARRQALGVPFAFETSGERWFDKLGVKITAKADRLDRMQDGRLAMYDYKTGQVPTPKQQHRFDKQLLIMAAMAEAGAFEGIAAHPVAVAQFLGVGSKLQTVDAPFDKITPGETWNELGDLIAKMQSQDFGFTSRRAVEKSGTTGPYDQLARFGEWDTTLEPSPENLT